MSSTSNSDLSRFKPGDEAPDFSLNDHEGNSVTLSDYIGSNVIVYFLPQGFHIGMHQRSLRFSR